MWLQQTWHQSSWSGFDFDKRKNFMGCKWSADWGTMNTALQYTALLDLMNLHFISVDLGCVSVSRPVSFLSPSPSPVPHFCPSLPLSLRLGSYLVPTFPFPCLPLLFVCLLEFHMPILFRRNCPTVSSPRRNALYQQQHCKLCGYSHKDSRKPGDWNMMGKYNGSMTVRGCLCLHLLLHLLLLHQ